MAVYFRHVFLLRSKEASSPLHADTPRTDVDSDLDRLVPHLSVVRGCSGSAWHRPNPRKHVLDEADHTGPSRQHALDHDLP